MNYHTLRLLSPQRQEQINWKDQSSESTEHLCISLLEARLHKGRVLWEGEKAPSCFSVVPQMQLPLTCGVGASASLPGCEGVTTHPAGVQLHPMQQDGDRELGVTPVVTLGSCSSAGWTLIMHWQGKAWGLLLIVACPGLKLE